VQTILSAGLALGALQHAASSGWYPTQELGEEYGRNAAQNAQSVGLPQGVNIWLDLEGVSSSASAGDVSSYCNAWFSQVSAAKYVPGLYVGAGCILDADQLEALNVEYFWKSASSVPYPSNGYCMVQSIDSSYVVDGVAYDRDVVQKDNLGHTPVLCLEAKFPVISALEHAVQSTSSGSSRLKWPAILLAGLLAYAAGVYTGPMILPAIPPAKTALPVKPSPPAATPPPKTATPTAPEAPASKAYNLTPEHLLLVGSFAEGSKAEHLAQTLEQAGYGHPKVSQLEARGRLWHVVRLGPYSTRADADKVAGQLKEEYDLMGTVQPAIGPLHRNTSPTRNAFLYR
jgi:hypothetical protein